jgi:hypothetical protein
MTLYRSANGKMVDMTKLAHQNELTPAVGNAGVNARGDKLGAGGAIIEHREAAAAQYHKIPKKTIETQPVVEENIENFDTIKPASSAPAVVAPTKISKDKQ